MKFAPAIGMRLLTENKAGAFPVYPINKKLKFSPSFPRESPLIAEK